jgi:glycosyltransferase involved in cell wall biosynthesis
MRVLIVDHTGLVSGAQRALVETVVGADDDVEFEVLCPEGPLAEELRANAIRVHTFRGTAGSLRLHPIRTPRALRDMISSAGALARIAAERQVDVVHANSIRAALIAAAARTFGAPPAIAHIHDCLPPGTTSRAVREILLRRSSALIAVSRYAADAFRTPRSTRTIDVLYNPIDLTRFDAGAWTQHAARAELGIPAEVPLVGVIAQITPWKSQDTVIEAFADVVKRFPDARLVLVGETKFVGKDVRFDNRAFKDRLVRLIADLGLQEHVEFWGERREIPTVAAALDVLAVPSWEEPLGRAVLEALAMETPVVATSVGGAAEIVRDGIDGIVVAPRRPSDWAAAITRLLEDRELRERMGASGRQAVQEFRQDRYRAKLRAVYAKTLEGRSRCGVLFVDHTGEVGGAQRSLLGLLTQLPPEIAPTVACPNGDLSREVEALGVATIHMPAAEVGRRFDPRHTLPALVSLVRAGARLHRLTRRLRPRLVHANSLRGGLISVIFRRSGLPVVVHLRDVTDEGLPMRLARRVVAHRSDAVIANSAYTLRTFDGPDRLTAVVAHNGVDTEAFSPEAVSRKASRAGLSIADDVPVLAQVAQITPWKRQDHAIRVLARIRDDHPSAVLLLAGSAKFVKATTSYDNLAYLEQLRALCEELGVSDHVRFLGEMPDVRTVLAACDVALLPSLEEPFGRTIIEAMAMERAAIGTSSGGPAEIIEDRVSGFVLPPHDLEAWTATVLRLIGDEDLRRRTGIAARARVQAEFTEARHAEAVLSVYRSLVPNGAFAP